MIKSIEKKSSRVEIDLTGPEGNAFCLLGYAKQYSNIMGYDFREIQAEMMSSDYDHLVETFDKHFGSFVTLYK